jgi:hypothetical protein
MAAASFTSTATTTLGENRLRLVGRRIEAVPDGDAGKRFWGAKESDASKFDIATYKECEAVF